MKKLTFLITFLCTTFFLSGQDDNNNTPSYNFFVGGQIEFRNLNQEEADFKSTNIIFSPYLAYKLDKGTIIGLSIAHSRIKDENTATSASITENSFSVSPFTRFINRINDKFGIYGEVGISFTQSSQTLVQFEDERKTSFNSAGIYFGPGIDFALADRWFLNAGWGAISFFSDASADFDVRTNVFSLNLNPRAINFSLNYLF